MDAFLDQNRRLGELFGRTVFFVGGTERSGTTWLQILLNGHPAVACRGEGHFLDHLFPRLDETVENYRAAVRRFNNTYFKDTIGFPLFDESHELHLKRMLIGLLFDAYGAGDGVTAYGEKTPGNIRSLDLLTELFPSAKFIFIVRDGRDVAVSLWHHGRSGRKDVERPPLEEMARQHAGSWRRDVLRARNFEKSAPGRSALVRYEDLHAAPHDALGGLFRFLDVDDDEAVIESCLAEADFKKFSGGRQRGEEDQAAQFRKGIVGDWRNYQDAGVDAIFRDVAGDIMDDLGYR